MTDVQHLVTGNDVSHRGLIQCVACTARLRQKAIYEYTLKLLRSESLCVLYCMHTE